jgi:uncharacterized membrane protein YedE/YeeE
VLGSAVARGPPVGGFIMKNPLTISRWSPYVVGAGIGVLSWITFVWMGEALGTSTTMVRAAAAVEGIFSQAHVYDTAYLAKYAGTVDAPKAIVEWQFALVILMIVGAFLAARLARSKFRETVPELWRWRFGSSTIVRYVVAFIGGAIVLFGARLAGGCTSGHGISGGLQLAVSSWTFFIVMFMAGIITAFILYGAEGRKHV